MGFIYREANGRVLIVYLLFPLIANLIHKYLQNLLWKEIYECPNPSRGISLRQGYRKPGIFLTASLWGTSPDQDMALRRMEWGCHEQNK